MFDLDDGTEHEFVLVAGPNAGTYVYVCDGCCALLCLEQGEPSVFHGICGATLEWCPAVRGWQPFCPSDLPDLRDKMKAVIEDASRRFGQVASEEPVDSKRSCPLCREELSYYGEPHSMCAVREILDKD